MRTAFRPVRGSLGRRDVGRLQTLGALRYLKFYLSAFIQAAISLRLNRREVHEDILSVFPLDKAVALGYVEPLHCTFFFHLPIFLLLYHLKTPSTPAGPLTQ